MAISELWGRFRSWPRSRPFWGIVAALGALALAAVVVSASQDDGTVEAIPAKTTTTTPTTPTTTVPPTTTTTEAPPPDPDASGTGVFDPAALLAQLQEAPEGPDVGYDRDLFEHWIDADGNGCDTRAEVLRQESITPAQVDPAGCFVITGDWLSIYDGYTTDDPSELDIDHVVALAEAWRSGASGWSPERRRAFANDLGHPGALVAVTAATNRSKGDRDPAVWQPPNRSAWCLYASDWITVKARWGLTADAAEIAALRNMLRGCGQSTPAATTAPAPAIGPSTTLAASDSCDPSYPGVCIPPAPPDLDCGDISARRFAVRPPDPHRFDGNDDGVGCESG